MFVYLPFLLHQCGKQRITKHRRCRSGCRCADGKNKPGSPPNVALQNKKGDLFPASVSGLEPNDFFKAGTRSRKGWIVICYWFEWQSVCSSIWWISVCLGHTPGGRGLLQSLQTCCQPVLLMPVPPPAHWLIAGWTSPWLMWQTIGLMFQNPHTHLSPTPNPYLFLTAELRLGSKCEQCVSLQQPWRLTSKL